VTDPPRLNRRTRSAPPAPVRIVHLGLGAFHRAHQAFYTDRVDEERNWGIAAFTGRRPEMAASLARQEGLYTLIERSGSGDEFSTIESIVEATDGTDLARLAELVAAPTTAIITLTVTEAGYRVRGGELDLDEDVQADLETLATSMQQPAALRTVPGRLVFALDARRRADGGPLAVVPCDNLADNAAAIRAALIGFATRVNPVLAAWIEDQVSFVGTCVDRITPATTAADIAEVSERRGYLDDAPVVTEPFHEWVLSGEFPAGRPAWERAGALFVDDVQPYERRKLWFLNGAHSLMAYFGQLRGLHTVDQAIADAECRQAVVDFWDLAQAQFGTGGLDLAQYRGQLLQRFANDRISHQLTQIAKDGSIKLRNRIVAIVDATPIPDATPALRVLAAWIDYLAGLPEVTPSHDPAAAEITAALAFDPHAQTDALLTLLEPAWGSNNDLRAAVHALRQPDQRSQP
jgi:fructuronate reductase